MRLLFAAALLLSPFVATAMDHCAFQSPRSLHVDLAGVRGVRLIVNSQDMHVSASVGAHALDLSGRACASQARLLDGLKVVQRRDGDTLVVALEDDNHGIQRWFGNWSAGLDVKVVLPAAMPVDLQVGSGDADVTGLDALSGTVGSGDLRVQHIRGSVQASVGSGDIDVVDVGSLVADAIGSGDLKVRQVRGDASIGSVGSGDVVVTDVGGSTRVQALASGDVTVRNVRGDFSVGAKGSGDVNYSGVTGTVNVPRDDD